MRTADFLSGTCGWIVLGIPPLPVNLSGTKSKSGLWCKPRFNVRLLIVLYSDNVTDRRLISCYFA